MTKVKLCPFCKSKAIVVCRVDSDWGVELKYKLLNDVSNYDINSMIEFENYDPDFQSGDYGNIYIYRCQSCQAEWGSGVDVGIANLKSRIAELEAERRWIPVSERLPKRGQPVLVLTKGEGIMIDKLVPDMPTPDGVMWWMNNLSYFVAHWMPLPELPEDK